LIVLALLALLAAAPSAKQASDQAYHDCIDAHATNADWAACGGAWQKREDARLNQVWKRINATLPPQSKADLLADQRRWIAFKDQSCRLHANGDWGREGQVLGYPGCMVRLIQDRIAYLESLGEGRQ
jgi:uncharacterized protein YecT (DUF1311 family)